MTDTPHALPRVWWGGLEWFIDERLQEYRAVHDPSIVVTFAEYEAMDMEADDAPYY